MRRALESAGDVMLGAEGALLSADAEILVPRLTHNVGKAEMDAMPALRIIATPSTGTDHIDLEAARQRQIQVISLRGDTEFLETLQSTAELTWLLILACVRRFREANQRAMSGAWDAMAVRGDELIGKTLGIVGLGRLGKMVARFGLAFRMRVLACDVREVQLDGVERVDFEYLLQTSDIVSIHVHLDDSTRHLMGRREIGLLKPGAVLVNTSRGAVVDEAALLDALKSGRVSAAGLDVLTGERDGDFPSHPLIEYARNNDHLILTPHVGGCTVDAQRKAFLHTARKIGEVWRAVSSQS